jgi:hypothetical protein
MGQPLEIRTVEDMHRVIQLQRTTTRSVTQEIDEIAMSVTTQDNQNDDEYLAEAMMARERELLEKYSNLATLIEHERYPGLRGGMQAGATFGVTTIIGEVLLANIRVLCPAFARAHRSLIFIMLNEISKPSSDDNDLVDTFMRSMAIELKKDDWEITAQERQRLLRAMMTPLAEAMVRVSIKYGLIESIDDEGYTITSLGTRVMLHLYSAQKFIEAIAEAHTRLQQNLGQRQEIQQPAS